MLGPVHRRVLDRTDRAVYLRRDRTGVASTVGTIMALLVFLTFLTLITNSYVPAWMQENERSHMNEAIDQFSDLKGKVDSMIVEQQIRGSSTNMYAPITLGSEGVPLFATATIGLLSYIPEGTNLSGVHVVYDDATTSSHVDVYGGGMIELYAPNRYYVQQWVAFENGAIIIKQEDGQTIRAFPSLDLSKTNDKVNIEFTQIDLIGTSASLSGSDSEGMNLNLIYLDSQTCTVDGSWTITLNTTYGSAWERYIQDSMDAAELVNNTDYTLTITSVSEDATQIKLEILNAGTLAYDRAFLGVTMLTS